GDRVRTVAVEEIKALARAAVVGIVVVRLTRCDALLIQERRRAAVPDHEHHVVLVTLRIREESGVDAARPITWDGQRVTRSPLARERSRGRSRLDARRHAAAEH